MDASTCLGLVLQERSTEAAEVFWAALGPEDEVVAPQLLLPECTSSIRRRAARQEITEIEAAGVLLHLLDLPIRIEQSRSQFTLALEYARRLTVSRAYDAQYLAVARLIEGEVVTVDRGMFEAAGRLGLPARLIG